jgi:alpha/beta superfamily hydrolase
MSHASTNDARTCGRALIRRRSHVPPLRFDFRGHGNSDGRQEDLTLPGVVNDIRAAIARVRDETGSAAVNLLGTSFAGGISALCSAATAYRRAKDA